MYNKLFTLSDLFHNQELKGVLPQMNITTRKNGQVMAHFKYDADEIIMLCRMGAMPFMKNIKIDFSEPMIVSGELRKNATIYQAYDSVLSILKANASSLTLLSSYGNTIEDVMKKIRKSDRYKITKKEPKLYLRINSINDIKTMNEQQKRALINNIVENIYFSDDFKEFREPSMERHSFIVNNRNVVRGYDNLKRDFDRKVRY
jgi:hypothetical protein